MTKCGRRCEVYSRVTGYLRPVDRWNVGKKQEYVERKEFCEKVSAESVFATANKPSLQTPAVQKTLSDNSVA